MYNGKCNRIGNNLLNLMEDNSLFKKSTDDGEYINKIK
jgi:hypothetical protein